MPVIFELNACCIAVDDRLSERISELKIEQIILCVRFRIFRYCHGEPVVTAPRDCHRFTQRSILEVRQETRLLADPVEIVPVRCDDRRCVVADLVSVYHRQLATILSTVSVERVKRCPYVCRYSYVNVVKIYSRCCITYDSNRRFTSGSSVATICFIIKCVVF